MGKITKGDANTKPAIQATILVLEDSISGLKYGNNKANENKKYEK